MLGRVAPADVDFVPRHAEHFGRNAMHIVHRLGSEISDSRLEAKHAVRLQQEQAVETDRAADICADGDAGPANLGTYFLWIAGNALGPLELLRALVQRLFDERAGGVSSLPVGKGRSELRLAFGSVDPADGHLID